MRKKISAFIFAALLSLPFALPAMAQNAIKRNDRPQESAAPIPQPRPDDKKPLDVTRYTYEFKQPQFLISHITINHDTMGRGQISFEHRGEEIPIIEPIELSTAARGRIFGLWKDLRFLDSSENYQTAKSFAHLGTYRLGMDDGKRQRTAEFDWSNNKVAWALAAEYRRVADQAILIFNLKLAREMQPLNAPQLLNEMEMLLTRGGLSDPFQLLPLLTDLKSDERIPLIA